MSITPGVLEKLRHFIRCLGAARYSSVRGGGLRNKGSSYEFLCGYEGFSYNIDTKYGAMLRVPTSFSLEFHLRKKIIKIFLC